MKRFALVGNPNSGKTTLFNNLTGSSAHVGNWPGVTVEKKDGVYKKLDEHVKIIDLPGIYSLSPYTDEEVISRNYILDEKPDCVINIVDATNLERNLYLTTQLLEIDVPVVVALNMMDVVAKLGDQINEKELSKVLGVPVVKVSALEETNLKSLMEVAFKASEEKRQGFTILSNEDLLHLIGDVNIAFKGKKVDSPLFHAIKFCENDELEVKNHPDLVEMVTEFKKTMKNDLFGDDIEAIIADDRYNFISSKLSKAYKKHFDPNARANGNISETQSDRIDKVLTHKIFGLIIFAAIMFLIFHLTFSENFFFLGGIFESAGVAPSFEGTIYEGLFWTGEGINSPGVILFNFVDMSFSALTDVISGAMNSGLGEGHWLTGFLCDGVLSGLFAILGFLPQILVLFLFFSIMEDTGYMARVAFIFDRLFRRFGLSGRAFIPMIMGFGCSVPAMVNTRTLNDEHEKVSTIRVIPFFSCGAKLPILVAIAGGICEIFGFSSVDLITYSMYVVGMITAVIALLIMRHSTQRGESGPFIMELPAYHLPQFKALMIHLWDKAKHFVEKAFTIILASTIIIWFLTHFGWDWRMREMEDSILASIGKFIQPIFTPVGFGAQLKDFGWVFAVAAITGLIAKENVIATFSVLAAVIVSGFEGTDDGVKETMIMIQTTGITWQGAISFIAFNMLTIPCFAACATAKAELRKGTFKWTVLFWVVVSLIGAGTVYVVLSCFSKSSLAWAIPVTVALILCAVATVFYLRHLDKKAQVKA